DGADERVGPPFCLTHQAARSLWHSSGHRQRRHRVGARGASAGVLVILEDAREWARGRMWVPRALLLAVLALLQFLHIRIFSGITLAFHEMGHLVFAWAPHFITALMGSVFQVGVPVIVVLYFWKKQEDYFGMSVGGIWLAYSLWELSDYVGDAR